MKSEAVAAILAPEGLAQAAASGQRPALSKIFRAAMHRLDPPTEDREV